MLVKQDQSFQNQVTNHRIEVPSSAHSLFTRMAGTNVGRNSRNWTGWSGPYCRPSLYFMSERWRRVVDTIRASPNAAEAAISAVQTAVQTACEGQSGVGGEVQMLKGPNYKRVKL